jgi:hypothetical protein
MVYFNSRHNLHLGLALFASLGVHAVALFSVQIGSGFRDQHEPLHRVSVSLVYERSAVELHELPDELKPQAHLSENSARPEGMPENSETTQTTKVELFSWHPLIYPSQAPPPPSDPTQAAMAAQMKQFQIQAMMKSLTEVASVMAPHIIGDHICKIQADYSVSCDLPSEFEWSDKLTNWLALQMQLQDLVKSNVPLNITGEHGNLTLQISAERPPNLDLAQRLE